MCSCVQNALNVGNLPFQVDIQDFGPSKSSFALDERSKIAHWGLFPNRLFNFAHKGEPPPNTRTNRFSTALYSRSKIARHIDNYNHVWSMISLMNASNKQENRATYVCTNIMWLQPNSSSTTREQE